MNNMTDTMNQSSIESALEGWLKNAEKLAEARESEKRLAELKHQEEYRNQQLNAQKEATESALKLLKNSLNLTFLGTPVAFQGNGNPIFQLGVFQLIVWGSSRYFLKYMTEESGFVSLTDDVSSNIITFKRTMEEIKNKYAVRLEQQKIYEQERAEEEKRRAEQDAKWLAKQEAEKKLYEQSVFFSISVRTFDNVTGWIKVLLTALEGVQDLPPVLRLQSQRPILQGLIDLATSVKIIMEQPDQYLSESAMDE